MRMFTGRLHPAQSRSMSRSSSSPGAKNPLAPASANAAARPSAASRRAASWLAGSTCRKRSVRALRKAGSPARSTASRAARMRADWSGMEYRASDPMIWSSRLNPIAPNVERLRDGLGHGVRRRAVSRFEIGREREIDGRDDASEVREHQLAGQHLSIAIAVGLRDRPAARRERPGTGARDSHGGTGIPDVEEYDRLPFDMEPAERGGPLALTGHVSLALALRR